MVALDTPRRGSTPAAAPPPARPAPPRPRLPGLDAVRVLALTGVLLIHADHWALQDTGADQAVWAGVDLLARAAVPLFVLLSAFLMAFGGRERTPWPAFLGRRLGRSLLPWAVWAPIYAAVGLLLTGEIPRDAGLSGVLGWLALGAGHLWFLVLIPQLYLAFRIWPRSARGRVLAAVVGMAVQTGLCAYRLWAPAGAPLNGVFLANGFELFPFWLGWFGVGLALGTAFARGRPRWPAWPFALAAAAGAALLLRAPFTGAPNGAFVQGTGSFLNPLLPLVAVPLFVAVALAGDRLLHAHRRTRALVGYVSRLSLGVYITHEALLYLPGRALSGPLLQQHLPVSALGVAVLVAATLALATLVTRLLAATPMAATLGL